MRYPQVVGPVPLQFRKIRVHLMTLAYAFSISAGRMRV